MTLASSAVVLRVAVTNEDAQNLPVGSVVVFWQYACAVLLTPLCVFGLLEMLGRRTRGSVKGDRASLLSSVGTLVPSLEESSMVELGTVREEGCQS
jgi:hypothetical protein